MKKEITKPIKLIVKDFIKLKKDLKKTVKSLDYIDLWDLDGDEDKLGVSETECLINFYKILINKVDDFTNIMKDLGLDRLIGIDEELETFKRYLDISYHIADDNQKEIISLIYEKILLGQEDTFQWRKGKYLDSLNDCINWGWLEEVEKEINDEIK